MQGALAAHWEQSPPPAREILSEISDRTLPSEHRLYIARLFRNLAKDGRFDASVGADVVDGILAVVKDPAEPPLLRAHLSVVLARFDRSAAAVASTATLLERPEDEISVLAVTALRHIATDEAGRALAAALLRTPESDARIQTIASAFAALGGYGKIDVIPAAVQITARSPSVELCEVVIATLGAMPSSVTVLETIVGAYDQAGRFLPAQTARFEQACRLALRRHQQFLDPAVTRLPATGTPVLERARQILSARR